MPLYLLSVVRPHGYDHAALLDGEARSAIESLNREMADAGVRTFVGGLRPVAEAVTLRWLGQGEVDSSSGPTLSAHEYVDGVWVLSCSDFEEATEWARKAAMACRGTTEVRPFY